MAAFTCTSRLPISLRSEMRIASSTTASLSTRQMFSVLPESGGLRTRVSLSSVSKNSRVSRLRRGVICEAQETATGIPVVNDSTWESLVLKADEIQDLAVNWKNSKQGLANRNLYLYTLLDLSKNKLLGEIPTSLGNLKNLKLLNISYNDISGLIPQSFGGLEKIEILDLSHNNLSNLSELNTLALSNNKLTGEIPGSPQLDRLNDPNIYTNNSKLCGMQIQVPCSTTQTHPPEEEEEEESLFSWKAAVIGCPCGFLMAVVLMYVVGYFSHPPPPRRSPKNRGNIKKKKK